MPIYEYECGACGHTLEAFQRMSEESLTICPKCSATALTKLVSAAGFQLKGTGWYVTDFKNKGKTETTKTESASSDSSTAPTKSETSAPSQSTDSSGKADKT